MKFFLVVALVGLSLAVVQALPGKGKGNQGRPANDDEALEEGPGHGNGRGHGNWKKHGPGGPGGHHNRRHFDLKCMNEKMVISEAQNKSMIQCFQKMRPMFAAMANSSSGSSEQGDRKPHGRNGFKKPPVQAMTCSALCHQQAFGIITESGKPATDTEIEKIISGIFPASAAPSIVSGIKACNAEADFTVLSVEKCESFRKLINCYNYKVKSTCDENFFLF